MFTRSQAKRRGLFAAVTAIPAAIVLAALATIGFAIRQESLDHELIATIERNDAHAARALLESGADPNARKSSAPPRTIWQILRDVLHGKLLIPSSKNAQSALSLAVQHDNTEIADALLARYCAGVNDHISYFNEYANESVSWPLLFIAVRHGNRAIAQHLLDHGATVNPKDGPTLGGIMMAFYPLEGSDRDAAPVHWRKSEEVVRSMIGMLVDRGADIHVKSEDGQTALDMAANDDDEALVDYLLAKGIGPDEGSGRDGALNYAIQHGNLEMARTLLHHGATIHTESHRHEPLTIDAPDARTLRFVLAHGADINALKCHGKYSGRTRLALAANAGNEKEARFLLSLGADANARGSDNFTPLMEAAIYAEPAMLEMLLVHGAKVDVRDWQGMTALMDASEEGNDENLDCLLQHDADPDRRANDRRTALMLAVDNGNDAAVQDLLEAGAKVNLRDRDGLTALDYADGNTLVINLLKRWDARSGQTQNRSHQNEP